jgi:hypothetical protein
MNKTVEFALNKFPCVPHELRINAAVDKADTQFTVDLSRLYHHYYTDCYGAMPPIPNHANFEYLRFVSASGDFRFLGEGPGANTGKKRSISTELGQAFCRYFLYEFCGITYFAHMDRVLNKKTHPAFDNMVIKRTQSGDVPDYLCAKKSNLPFIGEAKGRFDSISFNNKEFSNWRQQFNRIVVKDRHGINKKVKGYIVGTRFSTEMNKSSNKTKLFAEDPETIGEEAISDNFQGIGRGCIAIHYSRLVSKLGLNLLSESLELGFVIPEQISYNLPVWRCTFPPLENFLFVGGFFSESEPNMSKTPTGTVIFSPNILRLDNPSPTFYGVSVPVVQMVREASRGNWGVLSDVPELPDTEFRPSNLAWLRDGSISGGLEFFELIGIQTF